MIIDPRSQRRLLAASGYAELSLFQEAVEELEELPEPFREQPPVLAVWLEVYQRWEKWSEAEFVAARLFEIQPEQPDWAVALAYATRRTRGLKVANEILEQAKKRLEIGNRETTEDGVFSLEEVECIGACCWAPAIQVNYDFHEDLTPGKVDAIFKMYRDGQGKDEK